MSVKVKHIGDATLYLGTMEETIGGIDRVDHILTDPPYLYIKTHDFDRPWDAPPLTWFRTVVEYLKEQPLERGAAFIGKANAQHLALFRRGLAQRGLGIESQGTIRRIPNDLIALKKDLTGGAESSILIGVDKNTISSPIEHGPHSGKGEPWAITRHNRPLTNRQQALLYKLPEYDSRVTINKSDVSMKDLAALTAKTEVEFAMFTRKQERLIIRGNESKVNVDQSDAKKLRELGYKWSGHTHVESLLESDGDKAVLDAFNQNSSVIYNAEGKFREFFREMGGGAR
jgi:hypothetical protein